jgi:hypothetical protein
VTPDETLRLLEQIDAHRRFILQAYLDNPSLLAKAEPRIRWMLGVEVPFAELEWPTQTDTRYSLERSAESV